MNYRGQNMNVLVTGASSGIGKAVAKYLSQNGYFVVLVARDEEKLNNVMKELPGQALVCPCDLTRLETIGTIFEKCKENEILLNGMVCAAGMSCVMPTKSCDISYMEEVLRLNLESFIMLSKWFSMRKYSNDNASIVAISSLASESCEKGQGVYSASKAGLEAYVKTLSKEVIRRKIRVNAIAPAFVDTPMMHGETAIIKYDIAKVEEYQHLGVIDPEYIACLAEFLLSDKAKCITGITIPVNGGAL